MKEQLRQERRGRIDDLYRGEILDAAVAVLAAKGYHDSTMQEIAERVGMAVRLRPGPLFWCGAVSATIVSATMSRTVLPI